MLFLPERLLPSCSRLFPRRLGSHLPLHALAATGLCMAAALAPPPARAQAAPVPDAPRCQSNAYQGYVNTGRAGGLQTDVEWHRRVRPVTSTATDGSACLRYVLRAAPRLGPFDEVAPASLGGGTLGFLAYQGDQTRLLTVLGRDVLGGPATGGLQHRDRISSPLAANAALWQTQPTDGSGTRYVWLHQGRVLAQAGPYQVRGWHSRWEEPQWRRYLEPVSAPNATAKPSGAGLLDLRTLREVVPTRYADAGVLFHWDSATRQAKPWLLAGVHTAKPATPGAPGVQAQDRYEFFYPDGKPAPLPAASAYALKQPLQGAGPEYLALTDAQGSACHYYNARLQPLLPLAVPKPAGQDCPPLRADDALRFTTADGLTHRYRYRPGQPLQALGAPLPGELAAGREGRLVLQVREPAPAAAPVASAASAASAAASAAQPQPPAPRWRVYSDAGQPLLDGRAFEGFEDMGCGHWRFLLDGQWQQLTPEGQLSPRLTMPFSC